MKHSIKTELTAHLINTINDQYQDDDTDFEELHFHAFNEDYYIIGYYQASKWLESHNIDAFDAIGEVVQWEQDVMGEVTLKPEDINAEKIVNLFVYVQGEELIGELLGDIDLSDTSKTELLEALAD